MSLDMMPYALTPYALPWTLLLMALVMVTGMICGVVHGVASMLTLGVTTLVVLCLVACQSVPQGPSVDMASIAVPKVVSDALEQAAHPPPPAPPRPMPVPVQTGGFRAWIPPVTSPNGDVIEGHYVEVSDHAPQKELTPPEYAIPKAPKQIYRPAPKREPPPSASPPPPAQAPAPPPPRRDEHYQLPEGIYDTP